MANIDFDQIYEYTSRSGEAFCYKFSEPIIRNQDRTFFGFARVWKKSDDGSHFFNVYAGDRSFVSEQTHIDVAEGIEFHMAQGLC